MDTPNPYINIQIDTDMASQESENIMTDALINMFKIFNLNDLAVTLNDTSYIVTAVKS